MAFRPPELGNVYVPNTLIIRFTPGAAIEGLVGRISSWRSVVEVTRPHADSPFPELNEMYYLKVNPKRIGLVYGSLRRMNGVESSARVGTRSVRV